MILKTTTIPAMSFKIEIVSITNTPRQNSFPVLTQGFKSSTILESVRHLKSIMTS
jgi:hypothetical protein